MDSFKKRLLALMHDTARPMLSMHSHVELIRKLGVSPQVDEHLEKMVERTRQVTGHLDKFYTDSQVTETPVGLPEEKVAELIIKFTKLNLKDEQVIQCALITCDQMLNESKMKFCGEGINDQHYKFWETVKTLLSE